MSSPERPATTSEDQLAEASLDLLVQELTRRLGRASTEEVPAEVVQQLLTLGAKSYYACRAAGRDMGPFVHDEALSATEVMVVVTNMLYAAEIEVFELAMWTMGMGTKTQEAAR